MQLTNEWIERGKAEGRQETVLKQLRHRFGRLPANFPRRIGKLSLPQLDELVEALLDFRTRADAEAWLADRT